MTEKSLEEILTAAEQLHDQPQLILDHKGSVVGYNIGVVALAHGLDLFLFKGKPQEIQVRRVTRWRKRHRSFVRKSFSAW